MVFPRSQWLKHPYKSLITCCSQSTDHFWFRIWFRENAYLCDVEIFELSYTHILCFEISVDLVSYFTWLEKMHASCQILQSFLVKIIVLCISLSKFSWALSRFNLHTPDKIILFEVNKVENSFVSNEKFFKSFRKGRKIMFPCVNFISKNLNVNTLNCISWVKKFFLKYKSSSVQNPYLREKSAR